MIYIYMFFFIHQFFFIYDELTTLIKSFISSYGIMEFQVKKRQLLTMMSRGLTSASQHRLVPPSDFKIWFQI